MQAYSIEVEVPAIQQLCDKLQAAYDDGAAGSFKLVAQESTTKVVFFREYQDDAEFIEKRLAAGVPLQQAVSEQLAEELAECHASSLANVIEALRTNAAAFDSQGLPLTGYIGFVPVSVQ